MVEYARQNLTWLWVALAFVFIASALILLPITSAVVVMGGVLAALALLRWHELALYALIFAVPYGTWLPLPTGFGNITAVDLLVVLVIVLWFVRMMAQDRSISIRLPALSWTFALFLGVALLSMTVTQSLEASIKEFTKWLEMFAVYVYVANNLDEAKAQRALAIVFLAGISEAAIGIYQFIFKWGPDGFLLFGRFIRAFGTFEQPNPYAGYLALIAPVALGVVTAVNSQQSTVNSKSNGKSLFTIHCSLFTIRLGLFLLGVISLVATVTAIVMSWSRGAWLGVGAGLIVTIIVQSRRAFVLSIVSTFVLTFAILLSSINIIPTAVADRFTGVADYFGVFDVRGVKVDDANYAIVERMAHWQSAAMMFAAHPILGVGIGNYATAYPQFSLPRWDDPLGHAHNYYLNVAAETGMVGLAAYLILWASAFWQSWRAVRTSNIQSVWRGIAAGLLGMLVALSLHNSFDNLFVHGMAVQVGIGLGLISVINDKLQSGKRHL